MNPPPNQESQAPDSIKKDDPPNKSPKENIQTSSEKALSGSTEKLETAEKVQHEVQLLQRSSKSLAGSSSSKLSSSITGPVETQESMTFAVSELSGPMASGVHFFEDHNQTQEFTAQFSLIEDEGRSEMNIEKPIVSVQEKTKMIIEDPVASLVNKGWRSFAQSMQNENNQLMTIYKDQESPKTEKKPVEDLASREFTPNFADGHQKQEKQDRPQIRKPLQDITPGVMMSFAKSQSMIAEADRENYRSRYSVSSHQTNKISILPSFQDFIKAHKIQNENIKQISRDASLSGERRISSSSGIVAVHQQSPSSFIRSSSSGLRSLPLPLSPCANPPKPKTSSTSETTTSIQSAKSSLNESSLLLAELPVIMEDPEIKKQAGKKSKRNSSKGRHEAEKIGQENSDESVLESSELISESGESYSEYCSTCEFESESEFEQNESDYDPEEDEDDEEESGPIVLLNKVDYEESPECSGRLKKDPSFYQDFGLDPQNLFSKYDEAEEEDEESSGEEEIKESGSQTEKKKERSGSYSDFMMNLKQQNCQFYKEAMGIYKKQDEDEEDEYEYEYEESFSSENETEKGSCETIKYAFDEEKNSVKKVFKEDDQKPKKVILTKKKSNEGKSQTTENKGSLEKSALGDSYCKKILLIKSLLVFRL